MFVDKVEVVFEAGDGGNGVVSFRHEKFVDHGGPDGGDGGRGGSVILVGSTREHTLSRFRHEKNIRAEHGQAGTKVKRHGKSADDLEVPVPIGTIAINDQGETVADIQTENERVVIAKGGRGGFGNAHFTSSTRQAPRLAEKGEPGEHIKLTLELKSIADVGLIGLPNAGKSTLLSVISSAKPEIADYPFTTIKPNLGVVEIDDQNSLVFADIPGLIEGASNGKGLGDQFLRHIERTKVLVHLIDVYEEDLTKAYKTIRGELEAYSENLSKKPEIVILTKIEGLDAEMLEDRIAQLKTVIEPNSEILSISAHSKIGLQPALYKIIELVKNSKESEDNSVDNGIPTITLEPKQDDWTLELRDELVILKGRKIERFAKQTDWGSREAEARFYEILRRMGIRREIIRRSWENHKLQIGEPAIRIIDLQKR